MTKIKPFINKFIYETFRKRRIEDYKDISKESNEFKFPWLYFRVLLVGFIVFTIFIFLNYIFNLGKELYLIFIGGSFFTLAYTFLIYEIDNNKELSIIQILFIITISMSSIFIPIFVSSNIWISDNEYIVALRAGIVEEIGKALYAISICYILELVYKKKFKLSTILLIGLSVGAGFAIAENFGYMHPSTSDFDDMTYKALARGLDGFPAHMMFTGIITYAFFKFRKPLINYRFYLVFIGTMAVHTFWDIFDIKIISQEVYLFIRWIFLVIHFILSATIVIIILIRNNNKKSEQELEEKTNNDFVLTNKIRSKFIFTLTIVLTLLFAYQYVYLDGQYLLFTDYEEYEYYDTYENFKYKVQGNRTLDIDQNRKYDNTLIDEYAYYVKGELSSATQAVTIGDITYYYQYQFDEETSELKLYNVNLSIDGKYYHEEWIVTIDENNNNYYPYYDIIGVSYDPWSDVYTSGIDFAIDNDEKVYIVNYLEKPTTRFYVLVVCASLVLISGLSIAIIKGKKKDEELILGDNDEHNNLW